MDVCYLPVFFLSNGPDVDQPDVPLLAADLLRGEHLGLPQPLQHQHVQEGLLTAGCAALQRLQLVLHTRCGGGEREGEGGSGEEGRGEGKRGGIGGKEVRCVPTVAPRMYC